MKRDVSTTTVRSREALVRRTMQDGEETMCQFNMLMESAAVDSSRTLRCDCGARAAAIGTHPLESFAASQTASAPS